MTVITSRIPNGAEKSPQETMLWIPHPQMQPPLQSSPTFLQTAIQKCKKCCSTFTALVCSSILIVCMMLIVFKPAAEVVNFVIINGQSSSVFVTNEKFLSVALDSSIIAEGFRNFNLTNPKLEKLLSALNPGYFRVGGTMADRLIFLPHDEPRFKSSEISVTDGGSCAYEDKNCDVYVRPNFTMSGKEWLALNRLISKSGFTLLFDLNCLLRFENGSWNSQNAETLIEFSDRHNLSIIWELGNEPDAFKHVFDYEVNATQLGRDFSVLRSILKKYPRYGDAMLVGPDTTRPKPKHKESEVYLKQFLSVAGNVVDAITWHQYYLNGRTAIGYDFIDPKIFDVLQNQIDAVKNIIASVGIDKRIWLGETSTAYGGGAPDYSNRFVSTFMWLDKLGLAAKNGLDLVVRQSFFKGYYALLYDDYDPAPDYWVSVLYKKLVGPEVVPCYVLSSETLRLYCQCANRNVSCDSTPAIVVFGMNMKERPAKVRLQGLNPSLEEHDSKQNVLAYVIQTKYSLLSRTVRLNGENLSIEKDGSLPPLKPTVVPSRPYLTVPAFSLVFWVVPAPTLTYCAK